MSVQLHRSIVKTVGRQHAKAAIDAVKKARKANHVYELIDYPRYFMEITNNYFPQYIPYYHLIVVTLSKLPEAYNVYNAFDKVTVSKDICECSAYILMKIKSVQTEICVKARITFALKVYLVLYRLGSLFIDSTDFASGIKTHHQCVLEYINLFLSFF